MPHQAYEPMRVQPLGDCLAPQRSPMTISTDVLMSALFTSLRPQVTDSRLMVTLQTLAYSKLTVIPIGPWGIPPPASA